MTSEREAKQEKKRAIMRRDAWSRVDGMPFDDVAREEYAKARAKGASPKVACQQAGVSAGCITWERDARMLARIRELREGAETFVGVSKAWVIGMLRKNAEKAHEEGQLKSSNEALSILYKILSEDRDVGAMMARALPHDVTPSELQRRLKETFAARKGEQRLPPGEPAVTVVESEPEGEAAQ